MLCPFCVTEVAPSDVRFVAADTLKGDPILGPDAAVRFSTIRFNPDGDAIAPDGSLSHTPACPHCRNAWSPKVRRHMAVDTLTVGADGIGPACASIEGDGWTVQCEPWPVALDGAPKAALAHCSRGDDTMSFVLSEHDGSPTTLSQALGTCRSKA